MHGYLSLPHCHQNALAWCIVQQAAHTPCSKASRSVFESKLSSAAMQPCTGQSSHAPCAICIAWCPCTLRVAMAPLPRSAVMLKAMSLAVINSLPLCNSAVCCMQAQYALVDAVLWAGQHKHSVLRNRFTALRAGNK